ncbi:MAG TPA: ABC transporter permease subunit [Candidatus Saccharimonadales bacterium]
MMHSLFTKTLFDKRWFMIGWSFGIILMAWMVIIFFPSLAQSFDMSEISKKLPEQLQGLLGDVSAFSNIDGYITSQLYDIRLALFFLLMGLLLANSLTVTEEDQGKIRTLTATALSRGRILWEKWLAGVLIMGLAALATGVGVYLGVISIGEEFHHTLIGQLSLMTWIFGITALTIPMMIGFATGSKAITMPIGLIVTIGSFILTTFGKNIDWLEQPERASLMHYFDPSLVQKSGLQLDHISILAGITLIMLAVGWLSFRLRDLRA